MSAVQLHSGIRPNPNGDHPEIDPTAFVDPSAQVIGNVKIGPKVYVGPGAVIRADEVDQEGRVHPITLEEECNIQDGVIIHAVRGSEVRIGKRAFISHGCIIHGPCTIGRESFLGFRVVVYSAILKEAVWVGARATILESQIESHTMVSGGRLIHSPDQVNQLHTVSMEHEEFRKETIEMGQALREAYSKLYSQKDSQ